MKLQYLSYYASLYMFDAGPEGFTGGMNARKYVALTEVSKATATRDLQQLQWTLE